MGSDDWKFETSGNEVGEGTPLAAWEKFAEPKFIYGLYAAPFILGWLASKIYGGVGWVMLFSIVPAWLVATVLLKIKRGEIHAAFEEQESTHGTARFARSNEIARLIKPEGLLLGQVRENTKERALHKIRFQGDAHLITIAPTRAGKGIGSIIPNLLDYDGSMIVVDPKGEAARVTSRYRKSIGKVVMLDPFGVSGQTTGIFNPLDRINADNLDYIDDAASLAAALVVKSGEDSHFDEEAQALIEGVIIFVGLYEAPERRHLGTVREMISYDPERFQGLLALMQEAGGAAGATADRFVGKADREASAVLSTAQRNTKFLDSPRMQSVLCGQSHFKFEDLKVETATIFLCLPPDRFDAYSRWLRLMISEALSAMAANAKKPKKNVVFMLDEFATLGRLKKVEEAMGLMAGYGVTLWPFLQDLSQLKDIYRERAQTFIANSQMLQIFGVNDYETAKLISDMIGQATQASMSVSSSTSSNMESGSSISHSTNFQARSVLNPDELMKMSKDMQILFETGQYPVLAEKIRYFSDPFFESKWDNDPMR